MKIYFAGSIRSGRNDVGFYAKIIDLLKNYGVVLTEHVSSSNLSEDGEYGLSDVEIHDRDMQWVFESDALVAEVTNPSLGVGYEIGRALEHKKNILCLFRCDESNLDKKLSGMINGCSAILVKEYRDVADVELILKDFFAGFR